MKTLLKNGKVISPIKKVNEILDIYIEDGIIREIGKNLIKENVEKLKSFAWSCWWFASAAHRAPAKTPKKARTIINMIILFLLIIT